VKKGCPKEEGRGERREGRGERREERGERKEERGGQKDKEITVVGVAWLLVGCQADE